MLRCFNGSGAAWCVRVAATLTCSGDVAGVSAKARGAAMSEGQGAAGRYTAADYQRAYASGAVTPLQVRALAVVLGP